MYINRIEGKQGIARGIGKEEKIVIRYSQFRKKNSVLVKFP